MSEQYPGGYVTKTPPTPTSSAAPGLWTLSQQAALQKQGAWPQPSFAPPRPYPSWNLDPDTCQWVAPVPAPEGQHMWDEATVSWIPVSETP